MNRRNRKNTIPKTTKKAIKNQKNPTNKIVMAKDSIQFTEAQLVDFGNYLLSDKRNELLKSNTDAELPLEERKKMVYDSDVSNWHAQYQKQQFAIIFPDIDAE